MLRLFDRLVLHALVPFATALLAYCIGLRRRARGAPLVDARWTLPHACVAFGLMFVGSSVALGAFAYREVQPVLFRSGEVHLTQLQLARVGVASLISTVLAAVPFTRRSDWRRLSPETWLNRPTVVTAAKYFGVLLIIVLLNRVLIFAIEQIMPLGEDAERSTLAILRAIRDVYGIPVMMFVAAVAAPIAEEFIYRGIALDGFSRHVPWRWANLFQAALFALGHQDLKMAPFLIAFGFIAGMLRRRTNGLATGMVLHAINNTLALFATRS